MALKAKMEELGRIGLARIKPYVESETLRNTLTFKVVRVAKDNYSLKFTSPYYWARYIHDGRPGFTAKKAKNLVYFKNPDDDPRIGMGSKNYPRKKSDVVKLTKAQYDFGVMKNKENKEAGLDPYMLIRPSVGPAPGNPFLELGLRGFARVVTNTLKKDLARTIRSRLNIQRDLKTRIDVTLL